VPGRDSHSDAILEAGSKALLAAKGEGGNCVKSVSLD